MGKYICKFIGGMVFWLVLVLGFLFFCNKAFAAERWYEFNGGNECKITAYCLCEKCCGKSWEKNLTASGEKPERYITVANGSLPFGTKVYIEGVGYRIVQDTGSAVGKNQFDIYCGVQNHQVARKFGKKYRKVWVVKES